VLFIDGGHGKVALMGMHTLQGAQSEKLLRSSRGWCRATVVDYPIDQITNYVTLTHSSVRSTPAMVPIPAHPPTTNTPADPQASRSPYVHLSADIHVSRRRYQRYTQVTPLHDTHDISRRYPDRVFGNWKPCGPSRGEFTPPNT
jgi:hypothetical protein